MEGKVKFFDDQKGWGFITELETSKDFYFHVSSTQNKVIGEDKVQFEVVEGKKGPKAINIKSKKE